MTEENGVATAPAADALPLFYSKPEAMNPERHGAFGLVARVDFSFTRAAHALPVLANS